MSTQIETEPLSVKRGLGLLLLAVALLTLPSQLTNIRIELDTNTSSVELKAIGQQVYAESIPEILLPPEPPKPSVEAAKPPEPVVVATPPPAPVAPPKPVEKPKPKAITGNKHTWLSASNIPQKDWELADWLITRESGWRPTAQNPNSTAYGLKQFLDGTWKGVGCVKSSDPVYQLNCGQKYVMARYGSWGGAKAFWQANRWY